MKPQLVQLQKMSMRVTTGKVLGEDGESVGVAADAADVGIMEEDAALNINCDCFSFL